MSFKEWVNHLFSPYLVLLFISSRVYRNKMFEHLVDFDYAHIISDYIYWLCSWLILDNPILINRKPLIQNDRDIDKRYNVLKIG